MISPAMERLGGRCQDVADCSWCFRLRGARPVLPTRREAFAPSWCWRVAPRRMAACGWLTSSRGETILLITSPAGPGREVDGGGDR